MFTPKHSQIKRLSQWLALPIVFTMLISISSVIPTGSTAFAKPPTATPTLPGGATATPTNTPPPGAGWAIGTLNDSAAEFTGTVGTFTVGTSPTSAFPAKLSGANTTETIVFNLGSISGDYYLKVVAGDSAQNSTSGLQATLNGHKLTPRWAGAWYFGKWGNGGKNQGVQTLRWALTSDQLVVGSNTLTLRVSGAPNAGPGSLPDGVVPYFDMDYVALVQGLLDFSQPRRYIGSTDYWTNDHMVAVFKQEDLDKGNPGQTWINYLLNMNTLDSDIEQVEESHWTASYPDLTWMDVEPAHLVWDEAAWSFYRYYYQTLRNAGVKRILAKLQYTPKWASNYGTDVAHYDAYPPTSDTYWTEFVKEVALRVGDLVDDYAIMNEVNTTGFWQGTQADYERLEIEAYDTLKQWDTIDADGDGVKAFVAPSSSNEPGQTTQWQEWYTAMKGHMDSFHTHDYKWGIKPDMDAIQAIDPSLQFLVSETGPANWFVDEAAVPEWNPAEASSAIGYLALDNTSPMDFMTQWEFKGDGDKDAPWPNTTEWCCFGKADPYAHNDGYFDNYNTGTLNIEPPGPPYTNWLFNSSGAYWQHWNWVIDWQAKSIPVEVSASNCDCQYEVDAVQYSDRIEVILTNFQGGLVPASNNFTLTLKTPWTSVSIDNLDPDDFTGTSTATGPSVTLTASGLALDSARWILSNASTPYNAAPSAFITSPTKSATVAANVTINANAFDDGTISSVQYRIDPINNGAFTNMTFVSGNQYTATANLTSGTHSIQVKVTDSTGKSSTTANVVKVP
jgi:hypothetical protein